MLEGKRVVICENQGATIMQLHRTMEYSGLEVVGLAIDARGAVEVVRTEKPDIVIMAVDLYKSSGMDAAEEILSEQSVCIIMLTGHSLEEYRERAEKAGIAGWINKPTRSDEIIDCLEHAWISKGEGGPVEMG